MFMYLARLQESNDWNLEVEGVRESEGTLQTTTTTLPKRDASREVGDSNPYPIVTYAIMLPAGNRSSGPDLGRTLVGKASKSALRRAEGQPKARF